MDKVCPQFHLALQSGSDTVLARMARRYNTRQYRQAAANLKAAFPRCAFTTDVLTCFPGETQQEFEETCSFIREIGFSRIHVFPYSQREGTKAAVMPGQLPKAVKEERTRALIVLGEETAEAWLTPWIGETVSLLLEEIEDGRWVGYTPEYIRVVLPCEGAFHQGQILDVRLTALNGDTMTGEPV